MLEGPGKLEVKAVFFLLSPESGVQARSCWVEEGKPKVSQESTSMHKE